jgi:hypothetical protein
MKISSKPSSVIRTLKWSPRRELLKGALLGEVVERITGKDARIVRFDFSRSRHTDGKTICRYQVKSYAGRILVGSAQVQWVGPLGEYRKLLRRRMRNTLRQRNARPVTLSTSNVNGTIRRKFSLRLGKGQLDIQEHLSFRKLELLKQRAATFRPH